MQLGIYKINGIVFEGKVDSVTLPGKLGELTILPHHAPLLTYLTNGTIMVKTGYKTEVFPIKQGLLNVFENNTVCVMII